MGHSMSEVIATLMTVCISNGLKSSSSCTRIDYWSLWVAFLMIIWLCPSFPPSLQVPLQVMTSIQVFKVSRVMRAVVTWCFVRCGDLGLLVQKVPNPISVHFLHPFHWKFAATERTE